MVDILNTVALVPFGLQDLWNTLLSDYLQWIFVAAVAIFAIVFIKDRAWMKLLSFVGIAAIVGVLVFASGSLFGQGGSITTAATTVAQDIN